MTSCIPTSHRSFLSVAAGERHDLILPMMPLSQRSCHLVSLRPRAFSPLTDAVQQIRFTLLLATRAKQGHIRWASRRCADAQGMVGVDISRVGATPKSA
jgi:hypothetical protein